MWSAYRLTVSIGQNKKYPNGIYYTPFYVGICTLKNNVRRVKYYYKVNATACIESTTEVGVVIIIIIILYYDEFYNSCTIMILSLLLF